MVSWLAKLAFCVSLNLIDVLTHPFIQQIIINLLCESNILETTFVVVCDIEDSVSAELTF